MKKSVKHIVKERDLAKDLAELESANDFWQVSRDKVLLPLVKNGPVLDVGCGTGVLTKPMMDKGLIVYSVDLDKRNCDMTKRFNKNTYHGDFLKMDTKKFPKFKTIIMADMLEHTPNDVEQMKKAYDLLDKGGRLVVSLPYHQMFWTKNDAVRGHYRRYSKKELRSKLHAAGFKIAKMRLWNMLSVPPILFAKLFSFRVPHEGVSKSKLNNFLIKYFDIFENRIPVPIGSSVICVARKP